MFSFTKTSSGRLSQEQTKSPILPEGSRQFQEVTNGKKEQTAKGELQQQHEYEDEHESKPNFFKEFRVKRRPKGFLGITQLIGAYCIMFLLSSFIPVFFFLLFYLVLTLTYIVINHGTWSENSNFIFSYTTLLGILIIQGIIPLTLYKNQDLLAASEFWLLREFVNYFPMTCTLEEEIPIYEEEEICSSSNSSPSLSTLSSNENLEIEKEEDNEEEEEEEDGEGDPSTMKTTSKKNKKNYMFALYPHALIPVAVFMTQYYMNSILPGEKVICLIHSGIFNLPFLRFWMAYSGGAPATKRHIREVKEKVDAHAAIVVGGVAEMFLQSEKAENIKMRKGFIREAIRNGYDIVPVYYFGHTNIFSFFGPKRFYQWLAKRIPFPFFLYSGRNCTTFPRSTPVKMCVGRPIKVKKLLREYKQNKANGNPLFFSEASQKEGEESKEEIISVDSTLKHDLIQSQKDVEKEIDLEEEVNYVLSIFKTEISRLYYKYRPDWEVRNLHLID